MPRVAKELKPVQVARLTPKHETRPTLYPVGGVAGLHVQVTPAGHKSWVFRVTIAGKRRHMGLGSYPEVTLGNARDDARQIKRMIREGRDPIKERGEARRLMLQPDLFAKTFADAVEEFTPLKQQALSSGPYRDKWADSLIKHAFPVIGSMPASEVTTKDVLKVLQPLWVEKTVTADKLRLKMKEVFDYCKGAEYREGDNPAEWNGNLSLLLSSPYKVSGAQHYPSLQLKDVQRFWQALEQREGVGAEALRFQMVTATRAGAVRFMTWDEVDHRDKVWTVQPERQSSKINGRDVPKRVPLTYKMELMLNRMPFSVEKVYIFRSPSGKPLSDAAMGKLMREMHKADVKAGNSGFVDAKTGEIAVPHGTRSTFKVWATECTDYDWQLSEAALWHSLGSKVERAYARSDMLEKRRQMMEEWGNFLSAPVSA